MPGRDVIDEMCSELQIQSFTLELHDADARNIWFLRCGQVLAAIKDPQRRSSQAMNFAMGLALRGVPSELILRQLEEQS